MWSVVQSESTSQNAILKLYVNFSIDTYLVVCIMQIPHGSHLNVINSIYFNVLLRIFYLLPLLVQIPIKHSTQRLQRPLVDHFSHLDPMLCNLLRQLQRVQPTSARRPSQTMTIGTRHGQHTNHNELMATPRTG